MGSKPPGQEDPVPDVALGTSKRDAVSQATTVGDVSTVRSITSAPPRKPVTTFRELMRELERDRDDK
jgi:hypothetical protein